MGIANTTSAAAISHALYGGEAADWTGRGTGIDDPTLARKIELIDRAMERHRETMSGNPLEVLRCVGGLELSAIAGAVLAVMGEISGPATASAYRFAPQLTKLTNAAVQVAAPTGSEFPAGVAAAGAGKALGGAAAAARGASKGGGGSLGAMKLSLTRSQEKAIGSFQARIADRLARTDPACGILQFGWRR